MRVQSATAATTATVDIGVLAQEFALNKQDLIVQGLRAFILERLRLFQAEKRARCAKFGVTSLEEMDKLIVEGMVEEENILNDILYLLVKEGHETKFVEVSEGVNVELDEQGQLLGIEILNASRLLPLLMSVQRPVQVQHAVAVAY
jgi:uncharacterized protein YuzE